MPFFYLGDEAFQLTEHMMRPFPRRNLNDINKRIFNYRHSRARRVIENTFGILASKWRIFQKPINAQVDTVVSIVQACVCLHNFIKNMEEKVSPEERSYHTINLTDCNDSNGEWRNYIPTNNMYGLRSGRNAHSLRANKIREDFMKYFLNEGAVDWQMNKAMNADF